MTNVQIELKNTTLNGAIIETRGQNVYVKVNNDVLKFHRDEVKEVNEQDMAEAKFMQAIEGLEYETETNCENGVIFIIEGFTYTIMAEIDTELGIFALETMHRENIRKNAFDHNYELCRNKKSYAKLDTLIRNVLAFADR